MKKILVFLSALLSLVSCSSPVTPDEPVIEKEDVLIDGVCDDKWTYFSLEGGGVTVGQSPLGSDEQDAVWAKRLDWDFAICGNMLKTNSGTSGQGRGGVLMNETSPYSSIVSAPESGYLIDEELPEL